MVTGLAGPGDLVGLEALGADGDLLRGAVDHHSQFLDVRIETTARPPMRVGDVVPEPGGLAAYIAYRSHSAGQANRGTDLGGLLESLA